MTTIERATMLQRYADANRWLARVYDTHRTAEHRVAMWNFLVSTAEPRLRNLLLATREIDESCIRFWDTHGKN